MTMPSAAPYAVLSFGEFVFDPAGRKLRKNGELLRIDPKQLELLEAFLRAPQQLLSKQSLLDQVWEGRAIADNALSVAVAKLRKVLGRAPGDAEYIENYYGRGYRFQLPVQEVAAKAARTTISSIASPALEPIPLVGRRESLQRLQAALARAATGRGGLCALIGEPGIGKTRLAEALEQEARANGIATAWGRLQAAEGLPPLWPFAQLLRELNQHGLADDILRVLNEPAHPDRSDVVAPLASGFSYDAISTSMRTIDAIGQAIHRASRVRPLLLLLDDLQWADAASLRVLGYLLSDLPTWPIAIVTMQRKHDLVIEGRRQDELRRLLAHRNSERIELSRLAEDDVAEYVARTFGKANAELSREISARSEGNPFFMVELLRPWVGMRQPEPEQLKLSALSLDLVRRRLLDLPVATRNLLAVAAVIGRDFDLGLLGQVSERDGDELLDELEPALANDTVVASNDQPGAYAFDHELIREVLYTDLPASERCRLHLAAGRALEHRRASGVSVTSAELARHYLAALPQGDVAVAVAHARGAAAAATRLASHREARALLGRALEACKLARVPDPGVLTELLLEITMVKRALGDASYVDDLQRAVELARDHGFGKLLAAAGRLLSPTPGLLHSPDAYGVLSAALQVLPPNELGARASVLTHFAWTAPNCASATRVKALLDEAEQLVERSRDAGAAGLLRVAKLFFSAGPATYEQAAKIANEIDRELPLHPELARHGRPMASVTFRLIHAMQRGDQEGIARASAEREALLAKLNNVELQWHHERMLLVLRMNRAEFDGIEADLKRLRDRARRLQLQAWLELWGRDYGALVSWTGDNGEFAARIRPMLTPTAADPPMARSRKIAGLAECGFLDDARTALANVSVEWLRDLPCDREYLNVLSELAGASAATGSLEHCRELYALLSPYPDWYAVGISYHNQGSVSHALGLLARTLGRHDDARAHFEAARKHNGAFQLAGRALWSQFELAKLLLASPSERASGLTLLEQTREGAAQRGMQPLVRAVDAVAIT